MTPGAIDLLTEALTLLGEDTPVVRAEIEDEIRQLKIRNALGPVRLKHILQDLESALESVRNAADHIENYEDLVTDALTVHADYLSPDGQYEFRLLDIVKSEQLRDLASQLENRRDAVIGRLALDSSRPDSGGTALSVRANGTPKRRFINALLRIWANSRPDALSDGNQELLAFCELCWEQATGEESVPGLDDDLRVLLPGYRRCYELQSRLVALEVRLANLKSMGRAEEIRETSRELDECWRELHELGLDELPGAPRRK